MVQIGLRLVLVLAVALLVLPNGAEARHRRRHRKRFQTSPIGTPCPEEVLNRALSENFYISSCPGATSTVRRIITEEVRKDLTLTAGLLRLHFHDCFVRGCDASILINTTSTSELEAGGNKGTLRGMEIIEKIKAALEAICPGVVSCADIVTLASRDSVVAIGGPSFRAHLGRRDGLVSSQSEADNNLPSPFLGLSGILQSFASKGLSAKDLTVLSGAHTIGRVHCTFIFPRIYDFNGVPGAFDPALDAAYVQRLRNQCPQSGPVNLVAMDPSGRIPNNTFDSNFYKNLEAKKVVFNTDSVLTTQSSTSGFVSQLAVGDSSLFFREFQCSMEKMSRIGVLSGKQGEVRRQCFRTNRN